MRNINGRFEIIGEFKGIERGIKQGSCFDLQKGEVVDALLFEFGTDTFSLSSLVESNYQKTIGNDVDFLVRSIGLFVVQTIDDKFLENMQYLYITEQRELISLEDYIRQNKDVNVLDIAIEILQIINYFEHLDIIWRFFSKNNFYYDIKKKTIVLQDPIRAGVQMMAESSASSLMTFESDLSSLGEIILSFMLGRDLSDDPRNELNNYKQHMRTSKGLDEKDDYILIFFVEKLINDEYVKKKFIFGDIIDEINKSFLSNYPLTMVDENQNINTSIFYTAREDANNKLIHELQSIGFGLERKKVLFIRGEKESGKSTLASQAYRRSNFAGARTYMARVESSQRYNKSFLSALMSYPEEAPSVKDLGGREKLVKGLEDLLKKGTDIDPWNLDMEAARLVTATVELILANLKKEYTIFIIDGFDRIDFLMQYILMLIIFNSKKKIVHILVQDDYSIKYNENLAKIRDAFSQMGVLTEIRMDNFTKEETDIFLKKLLNRRYIPEDFLNLVYEKTYGNLCNIRKLSNLMISSQILKYDPYNERVTISEDLTALKELEFEKSRDYDIEKSLSSLNEEEMEFLKFLSVLKTSNNEKSLSKFKNYGQGASEKLSKFEELGLVDSIIIDGEKSYRIGDQILKNELYNSIDKEKRILIHKEIVGYTKVVNREIKIAMVEHLSAINSEEARKKAFAYSREIAESYEDEINLKEAAVFYEKLLSFSRDKEDKFKVLIKLFTLRDALAEKHKLSEVAKELDSLSEGEIDKVSLAEFYTLGYRSYLIDSKEQNRYKSLLYDLYEKHPYDDIEIYYNMARCLEEFRIFNFEEMIVIANNGFNLLKNTDKVDMKNYFYQMKAKAMRGMGNTQEATRLLYEVFKLTKINMDIRAEIGINNEIAELMYEYEGRNDKALEIFINNLKLSKKYGLRILELTSLINLSKLNMRLGNEEQAYTYAEESYLKSEEIGIEERATLSLLIDISVSVGEFAKGYKYFLESRNREDETYDNAEHFTYVKSVSELFFQLRNFERLKEFLDSNKDFIKALEAKKRNILMIFKVFAEIMITKENSEEELLQILEFTVLESDSYYRDIIINQFYKIGLLVYSFEYEDKYQDFLARLVKTMPDADSLGNKAVRALLSNIRKETVDEIDILLMEEYISTGYRNYLSIALRMFLADYYVDLNDDMEAMANIFEAGNNVISVLKKTPFEDRINLYEHNNYAKIFTYISNFVNGIVRKVEKEDYYRGISYEEMDNLVYNQNLYDESRRLALPNKLITERLRKNSMRYNMGNTFVNFGDDYILNLEVFMNFLSEKILATECYLCIEKDGMYRPFVFSNMASQDKFEEIQAFIKSNTARILRNEDFGMNRVKALMSVPIYLTDRQAELKDHIGILIFATDRFVNLFDDEGFVIIKSYEKIIAILIENYLLEAEGSIDGLTGTLTRKYLEREISEGVDSSVQKGTPFSLLMYDIDHFKKVNDNYGHQVGDYVLTEMSKLIKGLLEGDMKLGRYGGEEFIITLPGATETEGYEFAEEIRKAVEKHDFAEVDGLKITISIGLSSAFDKQDDMQTVIKRADQAMYKAKSSGRNNSVIWHFAMEEEDASDLKGLLRTYIVNDYSGRLSMVEMVSDLDSLTGPKDIISTMMSKVVEIMQAREVVIVSMERDKVKNSYRYDKSKKFLEEGKEVDEEFLNEILASQDGLYKVNWNELSRLGSEELVPEWDSLLGFQIIDRGKMVGVMYMKANLRDKEYNKEDLKIGMVFSTLVQNLI